MLRSKAASSCALCPHPSFLTRSVVAITHIAPRASRPIALTGHDAVTVQPAFRWGLGCSGLPYNRPRTGPPRPCLCHRRAVSGTKDKRILKCVSLPPREVAAVSAPTREAGECLNREAPHKGAGCSLSPPGRRARRASVLSWRGGGIALAAGGLFKRLQRKRVSPFGR